jgi:hypothetical protein
MDQSNIAAGKLEFCTSFKNENGDAPGDAWEKFLINNFILILP